MVVPGHVSHIGGTAGFRYWLRSSPIVTDAEVGPNYLCEGYRALSAHADGPPSVMADLIREGRSAAAVMGRIGRSDPAVSARLGRNDPCFRGSGKKYKRCHGRSDRDG